jgi:hypothetical protein
LTINNQNKLQKQVAVLSKKNMEENIEMKTKLFERDNDIAELKAAVALLADKVNAAIIANEPLSEVIFNQKGVPAIKIPAFNRNKAKAQLAESESC